jgi:hypothetical protein
VIGACADIRPLLGGYVLGALEPDEAAAVRAHLAECPLCATEHDALAGLPELLDLSSRVEHDAEPLPPGVEERLLDAVAREDRGGRRRRPGWLRPRVLLPAGAAAVAVAAAFAWVVVLGGGSGDQPPASPSYDLALHGARGAPHARARASLEPKPQGTELHLWVRDLPRDPAAVYEVHCDGRDWSASAGTFRVDRTGRGYAALTTAARVGEYDRVRVVRRMPAEDGGAGGPRTIPVLMGDLAG